MTEEQFQLFYDRTSAPLRAYLRKVARSPDLADDLFQDAYLRLLRADLPPNMEEEHRKNYLYRTATNLLRDHLRKRRPVTLIEASTDPPEVSDLERSLEHLGPRERQLIVLAYVEQFSHREIAATIGATVQSIRPMLFRARQKLATILRGAHT